MDNAIHWLNLVSRITSLEPGSALGENGKKIAVGEKKKSASEAKREVV